LQALTGPGESRTVSYTQGSTYAADAEGNLYAARGNRVIKYLMNYRALALNAFTDGGGTVMISPAGPYLTNTIVNISATPLPGWTFLRWTNDVTGAATNLSFTMTNHYSAKAVFGAPLVIRATNGWIERVPDEPIYAYGTAIQLAAHPNEGFEFVRWNDDMTKSNRIVEMNGAISLWPEFTAGPTYTLSVAPLNGVDGTVSRNPERPNYYRGTEVILTARPNPGYVFQSWRDNVMENPRLVTVRSNLNLFAVFIPGQATAPEIIKPPADAMVVTGGQAVFTVDAMGSSPVEYQWRLNGADLVGAIKSSLTVSNVQPYHAGVYTVVVTNPAGSTNATARLQVAGAITLSVEIPAATRAPRLSIKATSGMRIALERSVNLSTWTELAILDLSGNFEFTDTTNPGISAQFYRARVVSAP
jgi:hypothetical protein